MCDHDVLFSNILVSPMIVLLCEDEILTKPYLDHSDFMKRVVYVSNLEQ